MKINSTEKPYKIGDETCNLGLEELYQIFISKNKLVNTKKERCLNWLHKNRFLFKECG